MIVIRYSAAKLVGIALPLGAFAAFWLWVLVSPDSFMEVHGRYGFLLRLIAEHAWLSGGLFVLFFGAVALILGTVLGDRTALALGPDGIDLRTFFGRHRAAWAEVARIRIEKAGPLAGGGEALIVRLRRDGGEKAVRLSTALIEQSRWEINRLLEGLRRPGVGVEALPPEDAADPAMDYDAVIARHLAARENAGMVEERGQDKEWGRLRATVPRPAGGFGRKGL
jgi:hypothetical protein